MRWIATAIVLLLVLCTLLASGSQRDAVMIYFTVGGSGGIGGVQLWRCSRDGSNSALLYEYSNGGHVWDVAVDSQSECVFFVKDNSLYVADLDCSNPVQVAYNGTYTPPGVSGTGEFPIDAERGYVCWTESGSYIHSSRSDGSDEQVFAAWELPGMLMYPLVVDVSLLVEPASSVERSSWGKIKARFR